MKNLAAEEREGMSTIVRTISRWVSPLIILYALYIIAYGHLTPGGGFAGGVILACGLVLLMLAFGKKELTRLLPLGAASKLDCIGAVLFWLLAAGGLVLGSRAFFRNFLPHGDGIHLFSGGIIPLCNVAIALKVAGALVLAVVALSVLRVKAGGTDEELMTDIDE